MKRYRNVKILRGMLLAVLVLCLIPLGQAYYSSFRQRQQETALKELRDTAEVESAGRNGESAVAEGDGSQGEKNAGQGDASRGGKNAGQGDASRGGKNAGQGDASRGEKNAGQGDNGQGEKTYNEGEGGPGRETVPGMEDNPEEAAACVDNLWEEPSPMLEKYEALYEENNDLTGWLFIEGMNIDYPVMQCEDDEYYLHHDFYGNESKYGCLYVRETADVNTPGTNFIIYGHNMKDGSMFGDLDQYRKESFWREHPMVCFDTLYEERSYEVIAAFPSQVYPSDEDAFKYYQFYNADTQEEFDYFYTNIKNLSLYDTGVTAGFGDTFLTLSTCAYHTKDGRFVVVAKAAAADN